MSVRVRRALLSPGEEHGRERGLEDSRSQAVEALRENASNGEESS